MLSLVSAAFFFGLRPKKTQGEKTQELKNSRKKLKPNNQFLGKKCQQIDLKLAKLKFFPQIYY